MISREGAEKMVYRESFQVQSNDKICSFHDVTEKTQEIAKRSGIKNGIVVVYSHHTTCCVVTQECAFDRSVTGLKHCSRILSISWTISYRSVSMKGCIYIPGQRRLLSRRNMGKTPEDATIRMHICVLPLSGGARQSY